MTIRLRRLAAGLLPACLVFLAAAPAHAQAAIGLSADRIETHVRWLSDDERLGRATGTAGYDAAADYVEAEFRRLGLEPGGAPNSYRQSVPLQRLFVDAPASGLIVHGAEGDTTFRGDQSLVVFPNHRRDQTRLRAPVVFVGFGVEAPEYGIDSYAGVDANGAIVIALHDAPPGMSPEEQAHHGDWDRKRALAASHGAVGYISIAFGGPQSVAEWAQSQAEGGTVALAGPTGAAHPDDRLALTGLIGFDGLFALFENAPVPATQLGVMMARGEVASFDLDIEATIYQSTRRETYEDDNVLAILPGADLRLAQEYVVVTGHLDHSGVDASGGKAGRDIEAADVGQCDAADGDTICNGALDNAAGIAIMLDMARALSEGDRPDRSILFLALAAEEQGLLGSEYFVADPTVPAGAMIANINLDMPVVTYPFADLVAAGGAFSELGGMAERAAAAFGAEIAPDPEPGQAIFVRSDQYNFVKAGVPALFLRTGPMSSDPDFDPDLFDLHYHRVSDQVDGVFPILWAEAARFGEINARIAIEAANAPRAPQWLNGNPFATPAPAR